MRNPAHALNTLQRYASEAERSYFRARRELQQARSRDIRNKANAAQNWLKEKILGTTPPGQTGYPQPPDDTIWSPPNAFSPDGRFPGKL